MLENNMERPHQDIPTTAVEGEDSTTSSEDTEEGPPLEEYLGEKEAPVKAPPKKLLDNQQWLTLVYKLFLLGLPVTEEQTIQLIARYGPIAYAVCEAVGFDEAVALPDLKNLPTPARIGIGATALTVSAIFARRSLTQAFKEDAKFKEESERKYQEEIKAREELLKRAAHRWQEKATSTESEEKSDQSPDQSDQSLTT